MNEIILNQPLSLSFLKGTAHQSEFQKRLDRSITEDRDSDRKLEAKHTHTHTVLTINSTAEITQQQQQKD